MSVRWRRLGRGALWASALLAVLVFVASLISVPYYAITPGVAQNVSALISIPKGEAHTHKGGVLLTDVDLVALRAIQFPFFWLNSDNAIVARADVVGSASTAQYQEQGVLDMATAREAATIVALQTAGYHVSAAANGVANYQPLAGSPGAKLLVVGDVITSVDATSTLSFAALQTAIASHSPGETVRLGVHYFGSSKSRLVELRLGELRGSTPAAQVGSCVVLAARMPGVALLKLGRPVPCIGLYLDQLYKTAGLPFSVNMNSEGIIGPSAGLAFTLGLLAKLDPLNLTGGHVVAATGTMSINGQVGDVGGVAQKTVAVRDAGATLLLVPLPEYKVAKAHAGTRLKVVAVATIGQAIAALRHIGGRIAGPVAS